MCCVFDSEARRYVTTVRTISDAVVEEIVSSEVEQQVQRTAVEFYETDVLQKLRVLKDCCEKVESRCLRVFFTKWKTRVQGKVFLVLCHADDYLLFCYTFR